MHLKCFSISYAETKTKANLDWLILMKTHLNENSEDAFETINSIRSKLKMQVNISIEAAL